MPFGINLLTTVAIFVVASFFGVWAVGAVVTMVQNKTFDLLFAAGWPVALFFYWTREFWKK